MAGSATALVDYDSSREGCYGDDAFGCVVITCVSETSVVLVMVDIGIFEFQGWNPYWIIFIVQKGLGF